MENIKNSKLSIPGTIILSLIIVAFTMIVITILNNYNKIKLQQMQEDERKENEEMLISCISDADNKRANNMKSNCQSEKECELSVMEFLTKVYEQDVNNCYNIYRR